MAKLFHGSPANFELALDNENTKKDSDLKHKGWVPGMEFIAPEGSPIHNALKSHPAHEGELIHDRELKLFVLEELYHNKQLYNLRLPSQ